MTVAQSVSKGFKELPAWARVLIAILVLYVIYLALRGAGARLSAFGKNIDTQAEMQAYQNAGQSLSYPPSQYRTLAEVIYEAVDGNGTNVSDIEGVFMQMNTDLDVLQLETEYMKVEQDSDFTSLGQRLHYESEGWFGWSIGSDDTVEAVNAILASKGLMRRY